MSSCILSRPKIAALSHTGPPRAFTVPHSWVYIAFFQNYSDLAVKRSTKYNRSVTRQGFLSSNHFYISKMEFLLSQHVPYQQQQSAQQSVTTTYWASPPAQPQPPTIPAPRRLRFTNSAHVHQAKAGESVNVDWPSPQTDSTFPTDTVAHGYYLRLLISAFFCTRTCLDKRTDKLFTLSKVELTCRRLLSIAIALHTYGPSSLCIYDAGRMQNVAKTNTMTFSERIAKVCELLKLSKARRLRLLKGEGLHMCVAAPGLLVRQTGSNKRQNERRQEALVRGRKRTAGEMEVDEE